MAKFNIDLNEIKTSLGTIERNKKLWEEYYANPQYIGNGIQSNDPFLSSNPTDGINVNDSFYKEGLSSPQSLAPHGANSRIINNNEAAQGLIDVNKTAQDYVANFNSKILPGTSYTNNLQNASQEALDRVPVQSEGTDWSGIASGSLQFGNNAFSALQGTDGSEAESWAKTAQLTASAAKFGGQIGGPIGMGVGAVVGFGAGLINKGADKEKRGKAIDKKNDQLAEQAEKERRTEYEIKQAEKDIALLTSMNKSKLNYL
jgi:hypothetical protein